MKIIEDTSSTILTVDSFLEEDEKVKLISLLSTLPIGQLRKTINKSIRLIENDIKTENKDHFGRYIPSFKKYDIVHCHFTGVGFEWDLPHYAVVWNVDTIMDAIEVIPLTSAVRDEHSNVFCVNSITGLGKKQSTLLLSDKTRVSRKRLSKVEFKHPKHGVKKVTLPKSWGSRIIDGIMASDTDCKTFEDVISNECGLAMVDSLSTYKELRYKAIKEYRFDSETGELFYRKWDRSNSEMIQLKFPMIGETTSKDIKRKKIKWLNSRHKSLNSLSAQYFKEIYNIIN